MIYLPNKSTISNILLFDTYISSDQEPIIIDHDDATEFDFDIGGEGEVLSCKKEFITTIEPKCIYEYFFDKETECKPIWYAEVEYGTGQIAGPQGAKCAFETRRIACDGGSTCDGLIDEGVEDVEGAGDEEIDEGGDEDIVGEDAEDGEGAEEDKAVFLESPFIAKCLKNLG